MARPQRTVVKMIIKQGNPRLSVFIINKKMCRNGFLCNNNMEVI